MDLKYKILYNQLRQRLDGIAVGERLPSTRALRAEYGVSLATLTSALKLLADEGHIRSLPSRGIVKTQADKPAANGRASITLLLPGRTEKLFAKIISCCHRALSSRRYKLNLAVYDLDARSEAERLAAQFDDDDAGVLYMPTFETPETLNALTRLNAAKPVVQIDRELGDGLTAAFGYQLRESSRRATELLIRHGCHRIGAIVPTRATGDQAERVAGFRAALAGAGLPDDGRHDIVFDAWNPSVSTDLHEFFASPRRPDGLFATNSVFIPRLFRKFAELGVRVPGDLALTVFDITETLHGLPVRVTHIDEPVEEMMEGAVDHLGLMIDGGVRVATRARLACPLVPGDSCRADDGVDAEAALVLAEAMA